MEDAGVLPVSRVYRGTAMSDRLQDAMSITFAHSVVNFKKGDMIIVGLKSGHDRTLFADRTESGTEYLAYVGPYATLHFGYRKISAHEIELLFEQHHNQHPEEYF